MTERKVSTLLEGLLLSSIFDKGEDSKPYEDSVYSYAGVQYVVDDTNNDRDYLDVLAKDTYKCHNYRVEIHPDVKRISYHCEFHNADLPTTGDDLCYWEALFNPTEDFISMTCHYIPH